MWAQVSSLLHQIKPLAKDGSLGHEARMSLRTDIERMEKVLAEEHWPPGAIAIFLCARRDLYEEVPLPRWVRDRVIEDATAFAPPMLAVLDEYHRSGERLPLLTMRRCAAAASLGQGSQRGRR